MIKQILIGGCAALALAAPMVASAKIDTAANGYTGTPVPVENWALQGVVQDVSLSPSGDRVLILKREAKDGELILELREMANLGEPMRRLNANPMDMTSAFWVTDNIIFGTAFQQTRKTVPAPEAEAFDFVTFSYNIEKDKFSTLSTSEFSKAGGNIDVVSILPKEPDHILIATGKQDNTFGSDTASLFRPRNYYKLNLNTGGKELIYRGSRSRPSVTFDSDGNQIGSTRVENTGSLVIQEVRAPGATEWKTLFEIDQNLHENLHLTVGGAAQFLGESGDNPNTGLVIYRKPGEDKAGLYEVDLVNAKIGREIYKPSKSDVISITRNSNSWAGDRRLASVIYPGAKYERYWVDQKEKALHDKIERQIPNAYQVAITSRSRDGQKMIVRNSGPKDPGSYYLLDSNKLSPLGSRNPTIKPEQLYDVEYHMVTARDGMQFPVYVTKPNGPGPFPLVSMPHGGPHVTEVVGYDKWGQMLASNGYMVIQPQYRMSTGLGRKHFDAGYGEHGGKMQDDKDDAALWAVEKGWADKDRLAMHGFSYGGYAALVAGSRTPQIYQCAIAGAASANPEKNFKKRMSPYTPKAVKDWAERRGTIGFSAVRDVDKINIPVMMIHGNIDARVQYFHYKDYQKAVKKAGKSDMVEFVTIKDMDHGGLGFTFENQTKYYESLLRFLKEDCGPGGL